MKLTDDAKLRCDANRENDKIKLQGTKYESL